MGTDLAPRDVIMILAHAIAKLGPLTQSVGGRIGFAIGGERGGRWLLDLDVPGGTWAEWSGDAASTMIDATAEAFAHLILGQLPGTPAGDGGIDVRGDRTKLVRLAELIRSGGSMVTQRARAGTPKRRRR